MTASTLASSPATRSLPLSQYHSSHLPRGHEDAKINSPLLVPSSLHVPSTPTRSISRPRTSGRYSSTTPHEKRNASEELQTYTVPLTALDRLFPLNVRSPHQCPRLVPTRVPIPISAQVQIPPYANPAQPIISKIHTRTVLTGKSHKLPNQPPRYPDSPDDGRTVPSDPDSPEVDPINLLPVAALPSLVPILLFKVLSTILAEPSPPTEPPLFRFVWDEAAQLHNGRLTAAHNWDLAAVIWLNSFHVVTPGSEFRQSRLLAALLDSRPLWCRFSKRIDVGSHHPLFSISEPDRLRDLHAMLSCGSHKSAKRHETKLIPMLKDEVARGWQLPLPLAAATLIPGAVVGPVGMVHQTSTKPPSTNTPTLSRNSGSRTINPSTSSVVPRPASTIASTPLS